MATPNIEAGTAAEQAPTFEQQVNSAVSQMTQDDKGNFQLPNIDMSESLQYAVNAERRRRTTEGTLSRTKLQLKAEQGVSAELKKRVAVSHSISSEDKLALEELKYSDPDAWRNKLNELETNAAASLQTELGEISANVSQQAELETRETILADFNAQSDVQITDEVVANDIPPRITNKLANGEVSFQEFLNEAHKYLTTPRKVGGAEVNGMPNLGHVGGGSVPDEHSTGKDTEATYNETVY